MREVSLRILVVRVAFTLRISNVVNAASGIPSVAIVTLHINKTINAGTTSGKGPRTCPGT
jgi:hypothetical protein